MTHINIAIDGPAGAGKSTIARLLAKKLSIIYVDTGAMYRAIGYYVVKHNDFGLDLKQTFDQVIKSQIYKFIEQHIEELSIEIEYRQGEQYVILNGQDVSSYIRTQEMGQMASVVSANKRVRLYGVWLQQRIAAKSSVVMDGRDIGTFVLPDAPLKIFLTASAKIRALRRYHQLLEKGESPDLDSLTNEIVERDFRDMNRDFAPLKKAEDAIVIDTSDMTIDQVVESLYEMANHVYEEVM